MLEQEGCLVGLVRFRMGMGGAAMSGIGAEVNGDLRVVLAAPWNIEGNEVMSARMETQIDFSGIQLLQVS